MFLHILKRRKRQEVNLKAKETRSVNSGLVSFYIKMNIENKNKGDYIYA